MGQLGEILKEMRQAAEQLHDQLVEPLCVDEKLLLIKKLAVITYSVP